MEIRELKQAKFQKKDVLFSEALGVCKVDELTRFATQTGDMLLYYGLRSVANHAKVSYIPVDNHSVLLRELISVDQARTVMAEYEEMGESEEYKPDMLLIQEAEYVLKHFEN